LFPFRVFFDHQRGSFRIAPSEVKDKQVKALFVPFAPSLAHVSRCLAVADAWRLRGHTAKFAIGEERREMVRDAGFETQPLPEVPGNVFRSDQGWHWLTASYFDQNIKAERSVLAGERPDVVVFDFRFTTAISARLTNLPSVSILHGNAIRLARQPRQTAKLLIGDSRETRGVIALKIAVMQRLFPVGFSVMMRRVAHRLSSFLKAYDLRPVDSPFQLLAGDAILVADIPDFVPADLPSNHHIVGPLMWAGWEQPAPWLTKSEAKSLIYVTMGSSVEAQAALVTIIDGLCEIPYSVIISTGNLTLPSDLQLPSRIRVFSIVPGAAVVRRSRMVFHHGGTKH
jgi:UDP:flavonoid glycosyltransferase YjiC (YdhE family)